MLFPGTDRQDAAGGVAISENLEIASSPEYGFSQ
jgi:hypothetical protein